MKKRIPAIVLVWLIIDLYFFNAVKTLTANIDVIWGYWLFDALLATSVLYSVMAQKMKYVSWLMALMLISFVPKLIGSVVLLLEDIPACSAVFRRVVTG